MSTGYLMLDQPNPHTPQGTYPRRGSRGQLSGTCIVHTTEGAWTAGVGSLTRLVRTRSDYGCYHRACDWQDIARYYPWEWETWQDSETNNWAAGIAAACRTTDWVVMPADVRDGFYRNMGRMAADFVVYMRDTYGITVPLRRISGAEARAGVPGFCAHGDSGLYRSDPGVQFDWALFFEYTRQALTGTIEEDFMATLSNEEKDALFQAIDNINHRTAPLPGEQYWSDLIGAVARIDQNASVPDLVEQIDAAGLAEAVRDELVKLLGGK